MLSIDEVDAVLSFKLYDYMNCIGYGSFLMHCMIAMFSFVRGNYL